MLREEIVIRLYRMESISRYNNMMKSLKKQYLYIRHTIFFRFFSPTVRGTLYMITTVNCGIKVNFLNLIKISTKLEVDLYSRAKIQTFTTKRTESNIYSIN